MKGGKTPARGRNRCPATGQDASVASYYIPCLVVALHRGGSGAGSPAQPMSAAALDRMAARVVA